MPLHIRLLVLLIIYPALPGATRGEQHDATRKGATEAGQPARTDCSGDSLPEGALLRLGSRRLCHQGGVTSVLFSPDGKTVITSAGCIHVWDVGTGKLVRRFGADGELGYMILAPDGHTLAAECDWDHIRLFDLRTGKHLAKFAVREGRAKNLIALAFTPDGKVVTTTGVGSPIQFWDVATAKLVRQFDGEGGFAIAIAPDGKTVATGDKLGRNIVVRSAETGTELWRFPNAVGGFRSLAFSPAGKTLAAGGHDGVLRLWNVSKSTPHHYLKGHQGEIEAVAFSPDGKLLASGGKDSTVRIWEVVSGNELRVLTGHAEVVYSVSFSPDGNTLASGSLDGLVRLWDVVTGKDKLPQPGHRHYISDFAVSSSGKTLATAGVDDTLCLWDLSSGREERRVNMAQDGLGQLVYFPDNRLLVCASKQGTLRTYDPTTGKLERLGLSDAGRIQLIATSQDGGSLAIARETELCLWRGPRWREIWSVRRGEDARLPSWLAFSPDGKILAVGVTVAARKAIQLLDVGTGRELHHLTRVKGDDVTALAFSPVGNTLAVGYAYAGRKLSLWDPVTGREKCRLGDNAAKIDCLTFSPDGRFFASTGRGDVIRLWEVATGKQVRLLNPGEDGIGKVAYTPDGRRLVSMGTFTVLVWDVTGIADAVAPRRLGAQDLKGLWATLLGDDAANAYKALWELSAGPKESVPFVCGRLQPVLVKPRKDIARWITELDDDDFETRQKATDALVSQGEAVVAALREALKRKPSEEAQRRLDKIIESAEAALVTGERLRELRAVAVLEYAATPEAARILETLAEGEPEARLTREAKGALGRLKRLQPKP